jgi:hypothetical protein
LVAHQIYQRVRSLDDLRRFLEQHVFAVWDFMSLLKALQRELTCIDVPWTPRGDRLSRRLVNEIVLGEESDDAGEGAHASHFEWYLDAMGQCGADSGPIRELVRRVEAREPIDNALTACGAPPAARAFVEATFRVIGSRSAPAIGAAFTFGREEVIPDMFRALVDDLAREFPGQLSTFVGYLERHIGLDEDEHTPAALRMIEALCGDDEERWESAAAAGQAALEARLALWDGVVAAM